MTYDVLALGEYYLDFIFTRLDGEPELGKEVFARKFAMVPGGTYNTVVSLHRLGIPVAWAVDFGNDEFSQFVLKAANKEGIDPVCYSYQDKPLRNITVSGSCQKDRQFISYCDPGKRDLGYIRRVLSTKCRLLFISGLYRSRLLKIAASYFHKQGTQLVMDGNSSEGTLDDKDIVSALRQVDIFMPNGSEARRLTGTNDIKECLKILGSLTDIVVIKDGGEGSHAIQNGEMVYVPGIQVKCIDTTGAGDCFDAGFLKAYLEGCELEECLRWGNVVGGLSIQGYGGSGYVISVPMVQKLISKNYR